MKPRRRKITILLTATTPDVRDAASEIMALGQSLDGTRVANIVEFVGQCLDDQALHVE